MSLKRKNIAACLIEPDSCRHLFPLTLYPSLTSFKALRGGNYRQVCQTIESGSATTCEHGTQWEAKRGEWQRTSELRPPDFEDFRTYPTIEDFRRWNPELLEGMV